MSKSFAIKTTNNDIINYLLQELETSQLDNICYSNKTFKIYNNVIIHYQGNNTSEFNIALSKILTKTIINFYEIKLLNRILNLNYFYFNNFEKKQILNIGISVLTSKDAIDLCVSDSRMQDILNSAYLYICENKHMILDGFVNFRLNDYYKTLDYVIDLSVNKYLIEKEYLEFIKLLKLYISSKEANFDIVHLIYEDQESILIDEFKNIIDLDRDILNTKYLSDISFSSNDYTLNTLISLLPKQLYIHLIDKGDEFINTLKLIFGNRAIICLDCDICKTYRLNKPVLNKI